MFNSVKTSFNDVQTVYLNIIVYAFTADIIRKSIIKIVFKTLPS
jgi:hypothetical protein